MRKKRSGDFKKGQCANPGGRPVIPAEVIAACRAQTMPAIAKLIGFMNHPKSETNAVWATVAVKALTTLMDRGWGTAPQTVRFEGETTSDVNIHFGLPPAPHQDE